MSTRKTVYEWFNTISDKDLREKAMKNTPRRNLDITCKTLCSAFSGAFSWSATPEGHPFWLGIAYKAKHGKLKIIEQINFEY